MKYSGFDNLVLQNLLLVYFRSTTLNIVGSVLNASLRTSVILDPERSLEN